jgi:hypothetical protein
MGFGPPRTADSGHVTLPQNLPVASPQVTISIPHGAEFDAQSITLSDGLMFTPGEWPAEIMDSMAWSSQFFGPMQPFRIGDE